ncbi:MAG: type II toxin-antitoxin system VapC family toxin [Methylobacteriaceae bacterium]|nr:type II toxin-antitoxin system VapC family toxin [Methylobacteriaceae bacterium]
MNIDLAGALRRRKPEKRRSQLPPRRLNDLVAAADLFGTAPIALVPDTNVYIRNAAGTLPPAVEAILDRALLFHCTVCLGELAIGIGNADPAHRNWRALRTYYVGLFDSIPQTRILHPDSQAWADAGLVAGTLARIQGYQRDQRNECLNDALILLSAAKMGLPVLTADRRDFELIQQLAPEGQFIYY